MKSVKVLDWNLFVLFGHISLRFLLGSSWLAAPSLMPLASVPTYRIFSAFFGPYQRSCDLAISKIRTCNICLPLDHNSEMECWVGGLTMTVQRFKQLSPLLVGNFANNFEDKTNSACATVQYTILKGYLEEPEWSSIYGGICLVCALSYGLYTKSYWTFPSHYQVLW